MKFRISVFFLALVTVIACEQKEVPDAIESAFKKSHPNAVILKWNDEPPIWEAKYVDGTEKGAVSFNNQAEVVETELVITENQLPDPPAIPHYIKEHYPNEVIKGCEKVTKQDGTFTYEIQITGKELIFDAVGKFVGEELD